MELILLRHGQILGNLDRRFMGVTDQPLSDAGCTQALRARGTVPAVEWVYTSPLTRCRQTASLLWPDAGHTVLPNLIETDFGPFEGKCHEELKDDPRYNAWLATFDAMSDFPDVESPAHCAARAAAAMEEILADAAERKRERVGVMTHGGIILYMVQEFLGKGSDFYRFMCKNCGGFRLEYDPAAQTFSVLETYEGFD